MKFATDINSLKSLRHMWSRLNNFGLASLYSFYLKKLNIMITSENNVLWWGVITWISPFHVYMGWTTELVLSTKTDG